ncbi:MAG TPA: tungstate ABC transporter substrate-binding protein WtpA [Methanobacterium sp.]|nr:tungstate ABC transporter substrate-binding protein WtpA [Methanobacterium sp.]
MDKKVIAALVIIVIAIVAIGVYGYNAFINNSENGTLTIYAASSLAGQMNVTADQFEKQHPNVKVQIKYGGSSDLINQITTLNQSVDIMASADYGLIDKNLIPNYTSWNAKYARNEMVIAYTNKSKNASQINGDNWYQILSQNDVKFGLADPNSAPAGYRGVMMIQLANSYYNNSTIFDTLIGQNTAITSQQNGSKYVLSSPTDTSPTSKVVIRPAVGDLMPVLESGAVDYVLVYKSDAEQQSSAGVKYITLPNELKLSNTTFEPTYSNYMLIQFSGTNKSKNITLTPIVYGITILTKAPNQKLAVQFMQLMLGSDGVKIMENNFLDPISPAVATANSTNIPSELSQYIVKP